MSSTTPPPDSGDSHDHALRQALAQPALTAEQMHRIHASVESAWRQNTPSQFGPWRRYWALAVPALAVLLVGTWVVSRWASPAAIAATFSSGVPGSLLAAAPGHEPQPLQPGAPLVTGTVVEARQGGELRWMRGGSLRLKSGSRLRILGMNQVELESGSLYVALTAPHAPQTLIVRTRLGLVEHIGTQFMLTLQGDSLDVGVREGAVRLTGDASTAIAAGESVHVDRAGSVARRAVGPDDPGWAWVGAPLYAFDPEGQPVMALLQWAALEKGRAVAFSTPEARALAERTVLHGSIRGLTVDQSLAMMLATTSLVAQIRDDAISVQSSASPPDRR